MSSDPGVWKAEDCALVLIDHQKEMFEVIRSETNADLVELHVRLLAKTARAFDMPIVLRRSIHSWPPWQTRRDEQRSGDDAGVLA
jgi:nicotinamidase-related amidase